MAKAQRKLSKLEKGTKERKKQGKVVAKVHEKIRNQNQFLQKVLQMRVGISFYNTFFTKRHKIF